MRFRLDSSKGVSLVLALFALLVVTPAFSAKNVRKLTLRDLEGNATRWSDYKGRIVVLNFWATWCGPCKAEIPRLGQLAQQYGDQKVVFLLASIDESRKQPMVRSFVAEEKITLPVWVGASSDLLQQLSGTYVVPATLLIDANGDIVRVINGEARDQDIREVLDWLLSGQKGQAPVGRVKRY
jgi:thiol-disulfide isomerase/thioredoxin